MRQELTTFGGGCFWGVEHAFQHLPGVLKTVAGFMGGHVANPSYEKVCTHTTGHAEVVQVTYDPSKISYEKLLDVFWNEHDPTQLNRQGLDVGDQYRSVIFYHTPEQEKFARAYKQKLAQLEKYQDPIVTLIEPATAFYPAEDYHQQYLHKRGLKTCRL